MIEFDNYNQILLNVENQTRCQIVLEWNQEQKTSK
jgi:hypothetical protein